METVIGAREGLALPVVVVSPRRFPSWGLERWLLCLISTIPCTLVAHYLPCLALLTTS